MTVLLGYSTAWDRRTVFLIGPIQMVCCSYNVPSSHYHQCTLRYHHCMQSNLIITTIIIGNCDRDNDIRGKNNETETYVDTVSHSCVTQLVGRLWGPGKRQTPMLAVSHYAPWLTSNPPVPLQYPPPHPSRQAYLALGLDKSGPLEVAVVDLPIDEWRKWLVALNRWDQRENINISQWKPYKDVKQKKEIPIKICQVYLSKSSFTEPWWLRYVLEHESYDPSPSNM